MRFPPPVPERAPAVKQQVDAAKAALEEIDRRTGHFKLRDAEGHPGARTELKQHQANVDAARAEYDLLRDALDEAIESDRTAAAARSTAIREMDPADIIEGIDREKCCNGCGPDSGCMLLAGINRCAHPRKAGMPPEFSNDRVLRNFQTAASAEIYRQEEAKFFGTDEGEDGEDLEDEDEESGFEGGEEEDQEEDEEIEA